jgi:tetratricopeptide (TPR) repeat protein
MTLNNLGTLLSNMGRPEDAKNRYERALEMYETLLKTDPASSVYQSQVAMTLNNLGALLSDMDRPEDAKNRYERALEMREKLLDPDLVSKIFWGRGRCHESMGNLDQAYEDYNESIEQIELIRSQFSLEEYKLDILRGKAGAYSGILYCAQKRATPAKPWNTWDVLNHGHYLNICASLIFQRRRAYLLTFYLMKKSFSDQLKHWTGRQGRLKSQIRYTKSHKKSKRNRKSWINCEITGVLPADAFTEYIRRGEISPVRAKKGYAAVVDTGLGGSHQVPLGRIRCFECGFVNTVSFIDENNLPPCKNPNLSSHTLALH